MKSPARLTLLAIVSLAACSTTPKTPEQAARLAPIAEHDRRVDFFHHPVTALKAVTTLVAAIANVRTTGDTRQADFTFRHRTWTMTIDASGLPVSIASAPITRTLVT